MLFCLIYDDKGRNHASYGVLAVLYSVFYLTDRAEVQVDKNRNNILRFDQSFYVVYASLLLITEPDQRCLYKNIRKKPSDSGAPLVKQVHVKCKESNENNVTIIHLLVIWFQA